MRLPTLFTAAALLGSPCLGCGDDSAPPPTGYTCDATANRSPGPISRCTTREMGALYLGLLLATRGPVQVIGTSFEQSVLLAIEQVNRAGGIAGKCVGYVQCDTATVPGAPLDPAVHGLLSELEGMEAVGAVIGPAFSSEALALGPHIAAMGKPVISGSAGRASVTDDGGFFFRTQADTSYLGARMADLVYQSRSVGQQTRIFLTYLKNEYFAESGARTVADRLAAIDTGVELSVQLHPYDPGSDSAYATTAVNAALAHDPDIVVSFSLYNDSLSIVQTAIALGLSPRAWWTKLIPEWIMRIANDAFLSERFHGLDPTPGLAAEDFVNAFTESFGQPPQNQMPNNYDAACLAMVAMGLASDPTNGTELRDHLLYRTSSGEVHTGCPSALAAIAGGATEVNYEGASGSVDFDENGDVAVTYDIQLYQAPAIEKVGCIRQDGSPC